MTFVFTEKTERFLADLARTPLVECPSCEGIGYHLPPWVSADRPLDRVECPVCEGPGMVTKAERDDWIDHRTSVGEVR